MQNAIDASGNHNQIPAAIFPAFVSRMARETEDTMNFVALIFPWPAAPDLTLEEEQDQGPKEKTSGFCQRYLFQLSICYACLSSR